MPKADILFKDLKLDANGLIPCCCTGIMSMVEVPYVLSYMNRRKPTIRL